MKWLIRHTLDASDHEARRDEIIASLTAMRNLGTDVDPSTVPATEVGIDSTALTIARTRIRKAIDDNETILVYGDYDADGITATAVLWEALHSLHKRVVPFIPSRERHGYGLSIAGLTEAISAIHPQLIITVDNGIVAHEAADYLKDQGIDLIITDHHQKGETLPHALAIVHTDRIAGSAVSWFLAKELAPENAQHSLELTAIGTIADILPLTGINRSIVKFGLEKLNHTKRPGIAALLLEAQMEGDTELTTYHINYILAPRLNAMGRLDEAIDSLRLLCTNNRERASELAHILGQTNKTRQDLTQEFIIKGQELVADTTQAILVIEHDEFHEGVIGLVAGKLTEHYYRPSIVISKHDGVSKGSARSIQGVNIIEMIRQFTPLLINAGGHPLAAGFTIATENIPAFKSAIEAYALSTIEPSLFERELTIDCEISLSDITDDLFNQIEQLKPFGVGNPQPTFCVREVPFLDAKAIGKENKHLKVRFKDEANRFYNAIGFGMGAQVGIFAERETVDIAFTINENVWNGRRELQLVLKDIT